MQVIVTVDECKDISSVNDRFGLNLHVKLIYGKSEFYTRTQENVQYQCGNVFRKI